MEYASASRTPQPERNATAIWRSDARPRGDDASVRWRAVGGGAAVSPQNKTRQRQQQQNDRQQHAPPGAHVRETKGRFENCTQLFTTTYTKANDATVRNTILFFFYSQCLRFPKLFQTLLFSGKKTIISTNATSNRKRSTRLPTAVGTSKFQSQSRLDYKPANTWCST